MSKKAQWVIDYCNGIVQDDDGTKWGDSWLSFINAGQLLIADIFPAATALTEVVRLVPGVGQTCPEGAMRFLGLTVNMGTGSTPGNAIQLCDAEFLSACVPGWMSETPSTAVEQYMFDENEPVNFRVYPPVHATTQVHVGLRYAATPTDCASFGSTLSIGDKYSAALAEWCIYMALSGETDVADPNKAQSHLTNFFNLLGIKKENRVRYSPNIRERSGYPPSEARQ